MKIGGWILLVWGILTTLVALLVGRPLVGGLFLGVLGTYLIHRANKREEGKKG